MECNKEEASRARSIAERKMHDKDFLGARKFALKAQQLFPETENISQMICVCDVHCSAEKKLYGNESDWYGILQIEPKADDALIKKQYRKFALLLHPDKNKFAGAEAAFKLIGEAQRVLLDRDKRTVYDMKYKTLCKPVITKQTSHQANGSFNGARQSKAPSNYPSNPRSNFMPPYEEQKQHAQSGAANGKETFWTSCPFCSVRYQFYKEVINRALRCQSCQKPYIAYDMHGQSARPGSAMTSHVFPQRNMSNAGVGKTGSETLNEKPATYAGGWPGQNAEFRSSPKTRKSNKGLEKGNNEKEQGSKPSRKANGKRGKKQVVESSESFESDSSLEATGVEMNGDTLGGQRRSVRSKRHVFYNENESDDEACVNLSKRAKESESSSPLTEKHTDAFGTRPPSNHSSFFGSASASVNEGRKDGFNKSDFKETVVDSMKETFDADNDCIPDSNSESTPEPTFYEYPDPEFCDFDKDREENCFKVGQVWAAYDTTDAMPRFYARIRKIFSPGFKLQITWLEADPDDEVGIEWACSELPFSCGKFKNGISESTEDRLMFSHEVSWDKGSGRESFRIYPRKGETWALFKNWDPKWFLIPENERKFEYEFVEILSEYHEAVGISVAYLGKLKGFSSLFCRKGGNEVQIQPSEILRFAHRVPSYRLTGNERRDVPPGSYELDPASISMNVEEISLQKQDVKPCVIDLSSDFEEANPAVTMAEKLASSCGNNGTVSQVEHVNDLGGDIKGKDSPSPIFFNFEDIKSLDKFGVNQIWALYSDVDGMPKYYGFVKKVDPQPNFALHISWLEPCNLPTERILWKDKMMPIPCGQFKVKSGKPPPCYACNASFSHQLHAVQSGKKNVFDIYPCRADVWALYKNWHPDIAYSDLRSCEYDVVEVLEVNPFFFKVLCLERVVGYNLVFKPQLNGFPSAVKEIPRVELLRFSHQIPSFRLTKEKNGSLRGFLELDPAALPDHLLLKSK